MFTFDKQQSAVPSLVFGDNDLIYNLGRKGIPVYVGSENPENPAYYSRYCKKKILFSSYESAEFIDELCALGKQEKQRPVIFTHDDRALMNISRNRERLRHYYRFLLPEHDLVKNLLDKRLFCDLAESCNLPAPASAEISSAEELKLAVSNIPAPYIIKPIYRHHWYNEEFRSAMGVYKKAFICSSEKELMNKYEKIATVNPSVIIQEYIAGDDDRMYDVNLYIDKNKTVRGSVIARKLRVYPPGAGWGCFVETVTDREISEKAAEIASVLELQGLVNIQFKRDSRTDEARLIEIHPRSSIFDILGTIAGLNLPILYHMDLTGISLPESTAYKTGIKYFNLQREIQLSLKHRQNEEYSLGAWVRSYFGKKIIADLLLYDPVPFLMKIWFILQKKMLHAKTGNKGMDTAVNPDEEKPAEENTGKVPAEIRR